MGLTPLQRKYYKKHPEFWLRDYLHIPVETLKWSMHPAYEGIYTDEDGNYTDAWDGTPDPLYSILKSIAEWEDTAVESSTGTGKTYLCAGVLLWFLSVHGGQKVKTDAKYRNGKKVDVADKYLGCSVLTLGPKEESLKSNLWKEVGGHWENFKKLHPKAELLSLEIRMDPEIPAWRAKGLSVGVGAEEGSATKAAGYHDPYMLYILEECPGIPNPVIEAVVNTCIEETNIILAVGNPQSVYDGLHMFTSLPSTKSVRISSYDHVNVVAGHSVIPGAVSQKSIDKRLARYGPNDPLFLGMVRGICPNISNTGLFRNEDLMAAEGNLVDPLKVIPSSSVYSEGGIRIYSEVKHTHLNRYIVFGDVAGDGGRGDWHAAIVLDRLKMEPAAIVHMRGPREDYVTALLDVCDLYRIRWTQMTRQSFEQRYWYPLLSWEKTGVGALIMDPRIKNYPNLYHKRNMDVLNPNIQQSVGWDTTSKSRKVMCDELQEWGLDLRHKPWRLKDKTLYKECSTFVWISRGNNGRYEAQKGTDIKGDPHRDDLVMSLGGSLAIHKLIPHPEIQEKPPEVVPTIHDNHFKKVVSYRSNPDDGDPWIKGFNEDEWNNAALPRM